MPEAGDRSIDAGDWIEIEFVVMEPGDRVVSAADTAQLPLLGRVRGFAAESTTIGGEVVVETLSGRRQLGTVIGGEPGHHHSFGRTNPLVLVGGMHAKRISRS